MVNFTSEEQEVDQKVEAIAATQEEADHENPDLVPDLEGLKHHLNSASNLLTTFCKQATLHTEKAIEKSRKQHHKMMEKNDEEWRKKLKWQGELFGQERAMLQEEKRNLQDTTDQQQKSLEDKTAINMAQQKQMEDFQKKAEASLETMKEYHCKKMDEMKETHLSNMEEIKNEHSKQIESWKKSVEEVKEDNRILFEQGVVRLGSMLMEEKQKDGQEITKLMAENESLQKDKDRLESEVVTLKSEVAGVKEEKRVEVEKLEKENQKLRKKKKKSTRPRRRGMLSLFQ